MAKGGSVKSFCAEERPHARECEYFSEGGDIVPDDDVSLESPQTSADIVPDDEVTFADPKSGAGSDGEVTASPPKDYGTPPQKALTYYEGIGRGFAGPVATGAELGLSALGVPGLSAADQRGRQEENPALSAGAEGLSTAASMAMGIGEVGLATKGALAAAKYANFGKLGTATLKNAIQGAAMTAGDEATKAMLGEGDPETPVASALIHMGAGALFNMGAAGAFHLTGKAVNKAVTAIPEHLGDWTAHYLSGFGYGSQSLQAELGAVGVGPKVEPPDLKALAKTIGIEGENLAAFEKGLKSGQDFVGSTAKKTISTISRAAGAITGSFLDQLGGFGFWLGERAGAVVGKPIAEAVSPAMKYANQYIYPAIAKTLETGAAEYGIAVLNYAKGAAKGFQSLGGAVDALFKGGAEAIGNGALTEANRSKLRAYMDEGGVTQELQSTIDAQNSQSSPDPHFAAGGAVKAPGSTLPSGSLLSPNGIDQVYPAQNQLLNTAKGRVSNYLNSLRPMGEGSRLAFDAPSINHQKERAYRQAIDIALDPISVLGHVQKGTLESSHVRHLAAMYPEVHGAMSKKITEKVVESQLSGARPPYATRQGLSLLLGAPLSSEMTPSSIAAAQAVFATQKQARAQAQGKPATKEKKSAIGQADESYRTSNQAAIARSQRGS